MDQKSSSTFQKLKLLLTLPLFALVFMAFAEPKYMLEPISSKNQTAGPKYSWKFVKGKVVKEDGSPLFPAVVYVPYSSLGTVTDASGNFQIFIPENSSLSIEFIGFKKVNIILPYDKEMIIMLKTEIIRIDPIEIYPPNYPDNKKNLNFIAKGSEHFRQTENTTDQGPTIKQNEIPDVQFVENKAIINLNNALIVKNDTICPNLKLEDIDPTNNWLIRLLDKANAIKKYGAIAENGVIAISTEREMYHFVEEMPEFPGGIMNLRKVFKTNLIYPEIALKKGIQGTVYVRFVVSEDGSVTQVKIEKGVDQTLDDEVLRVVKNLPKWRPGKQRGMPIKVSYEIPVRFRIPDDYQPKSAGKLKEVK